MIVVVVVIMEIARGRLGAARRNLSRWMRSASVAHMNNNNNDSSNNSSNSSSSSSGTTSKSKSKSNSSSTKKNVYASMNAETYM